MKHFFDVGKADIAVVQKFNNAIDSLFEVEQKDSSFSRAVFLHQLINVLLDNETLDKFTFEINEWVNEFHRN